MRIALYQEFGEGCRRLTHELLPAQPAGNCWTCRTLARILPRSAAEDAETIRSADVVIASPLSPFPEAIYDPRGQVRLIQLLSAGYDKVDLDRCRAAGQLSRHQRRRERRGRGGAHDPVHPRGAPAAAGPGPRYARRPLDGGQDSGVGAARTGGSHRWAGGHGADWPGGRAAAATVRRATPILRRGAGAQRGDRQTYRCATCRGQNCWRPRTLSRCTCR